MDCLLGLNVAKLQWPSPVVHRSLAPPDPRARAGFPHSLRNPADVGVSFWACASHYRVRSQAFNLALGRARKITTRSPCVHRPLTQRYRNAHTLGFLGSSGSHSLPPPRGSQRVAKVNRKSRTSQLTRWVCITARCAGMAKMRRWACSGRVVPPRKAESPWSSACWNRNGTGSDPC